MKIIANMKIMKMNKNKEQHQAVFIYSFILEFNETFDIIVTT